MIEFKNVTKLYGRVIGVNDLTLTLEPGAYGLLGPNGAGKSTLLNLITGQLRPTIGTVRVMGSSPCHSATLFRRLGYCPGSEGMYSDVTGYDWVRYLQRLQGMTAAEADRAAQSALDLVGMTAAMKRPISSYSRGMRQRTKLAQAIAHNPDFLILDEPFNGLDPIGRHELTNVLLNWIGQGKSLIFASHLLHEIETITQSFLLICGGRLLASGTAAEVQAMMVDLPSEVELSCSEPRKLASRIVAEGVADSVSIADSKIRVATSQPARFFELLPAWITDLNVQVFELNSSDDSLQALFNSLMKMHRGEM